MTDPLRLVILLHLHRPPGRSQEEIEQEWRDCYEPLIGALHHTPEVRCGLVVGGELIEDLQAHHPVAIQWISELVARDQVELMASALHEPVLSAVPERDGTGQLQAHATLVKRVFGVRPAGAWLPHLVWDPSVPRILSRASLEWTAVPDAYLEEAGAPGPVSGVYRTEREGLSVALLPIDTESVSMAGNVPVRQLFLRLRRRAQRGDGLITLALPAATFGLRPGHDPKVDQSWLATLFAGLVNASPEVQTWLPSAAVAGGPYRGRIYLPSGTPGQLHVPWERHLARYDEANRLHKKMLRVSRVVNKLRVLIGQTAHSDVRPDPELLHQAQRYLYRAQAAEVYGHDEHAGIYDPAARGRAWKDLLRSERVALTGLGTRGRLYVETVDMDCDGVKEVILRTPDAVVVIDPARGGGVSELSLYGPARNLINTMSRLPEPYHQPADPASLPQDADAATSEPWAEDVPTVAAHPGFSTTRAFLLRDVQRGLSCDLRPRVCFVERLLGPDVTLDALKRGNFTEAGRGFQDSVWDLVTAERHGDEALSCILTTGARVSDAAGERRATLTKRYVLGCDGRLDYRFEIANKSHEALRTRLAVELNLTLGPDADAQAIVLPNGKRYAYNRARDLGEQDSVVLEAPDLSVEIGLGRPARVWQYPVQTVHRQGGEQVVAIQGICLVFQWPLELWGKEKDRVTITFGGLS